MTTASTAGRLRSPSSAARFYCLAALSFAAMVSFIDRQVINLLVDPIKADLGLTDVQIGLVQGFSFALFYAVFAIPLAWIADRHERKWVIIAGVVIWSAATFSSGLAGAFLVLFVARMMVGIGEAALTPAGTSMLSDYFSNEKLPLAVSIFTGAGYVGSGLALILGGYLYDRLDRMGSVELPFGSFEPWQATFMIVALLSVPLLLCLLAMREPPRRETAGAATASQPPSTAETTRFLADHGKLFALLFLGFSCMAAAQFGIGAWAPTYFIRIHGWSPLQVGQLFGPVVMVAGLGGVIGGGFAAERLLARGVRDATLRVPIIGVLIALPCAIAFPLMSSPYVALGLLALTMFFGSSPFGAGVATYPLITPNRMRAQVIALYMLVANLFGYSAGPLLVAGITETVFGDPDAIDLSLATGPAATMVVGLVLVGIALRPYHRMLDKRQAALAAGQAQPA